MNLFDIFEGEEKIILYFNGKPVATYASAAEAEYQARLVQKKYPNTKVEFKKEVCNLTPIELEENLKSCMAEGSLNEFAPPDSGDDRNYEYEVYQCNPDDQFDWIGGPIYKSDDMGKVHSIAYNLHKKHPDKAFMIWQERSQGSRGGYGIKDDEQGVEEGSEWPFDDEVEEQRVGPVMPITPIQPTRTYPPQQIYVPPNTTSRPQNVPSGGTSTPGRPAVVLDINNELLRETVSGLDLANVIFDQLSKLDVDVVRQYGHDVVGDAIMDVVDAYGEVKSMSDLDLAVKDVLAKLKKGLSEGKHYFNIISTSNADLRKKFGMLRDRQGWYLKEDQNNFKQLYLEASRTFTEYDLSKHTVSAATIGDDNFISPVGSVPRSQQKQKVKKNG